MQRAPRASARALKNRTGRNVQKTARKAWRPRAAARYWRRIDKRAGGGQGARTAARAWSHMSRQSVIVVVMDGSVNVASGGWLAGGEPAPEGFSPVFSVRQATPHQKAGVCIWGAEASFRLRAGGEGRMCDRKKPSVDRQLPRSLAQVRAIIEGKRHACPCYLRSVLHSSTEGAEDG